MWRKICEEIWFLPFLYSCGPFVSHTDTITLAAQNGATSEQRTTERSLGLISDYGKGVAGRNPSELWWREDLGLCMDNQNLTGSYCKNMAGMAD